MKYVFQVIAGLLLFFGAQRAFGQTDKALLRELAEENKKTVEALALYPEDTRLAILEACKYPEVLVKMNSVREKTAAAYRTLIEDFPRNTQEIFYELSRYPGLTGKIAAEKSPAAVKQLLTQLPENMRDDAFDVSQNQARTLQKIDDLDQTARRTLDDLIAGYPAPAQAAFRQLVGLPEVLDLLNQDLRFTVLVGDAYRDDPASVIRQTDSLHLAVARAHAQELEDWKKEIENDPQAQQEMAAASKEYATEYGYDSEDYPYDDLYDSYETRRTTHYYDYYYPWWFGYPWWYPAPCWRPYPYWYDWGFYPYHQSIVIVYLPSYHFMDWYFYHPHHHYKYNKLSTHFVNHYYGHRRSGTSITMGVGEWRDRNRTVVSDEWLQDKKRLSGRLQEYGRFEEARQTYNAANPKRTMSPQDFLDKNTRKYPELTSGREMVKAEIQRDENAVRKERTDWAPAKEPVQPRPPRVSDQKPQEPKREPQQKPERPQTEKPPEKVIKQRPIEEAKDYHRNKWDETKRSDPPRDPAPKTRPAPKQPAKKDAAPSKPSNKSGKTRGNK